MPCKADASFSSVGSRALRNSVAYGSVYESFLSQLDSLTAAWVPIYLPVLIRASDGFFAFSGIIQYAPAFCAPVTRPSPQRATTRRLERCQRSAAGKQQCDPQHKIVVVAGFRAFCAGARVGLRRIGRFCCGAGSRNLNCRLLVAANLAFFMLGALLGMGMGNCLVCYNNGFICVHRNIQDIGKYVCCNAVHSNNVDFIAVIRGKDNRFGGAFGQSGFACGNRSVTAVYLCCKAM